MNTLIVPIVLSLLSAVHSYVIPHAHPFGPVGPGKVFVPYPTYVGHIPLGHHPHVVHTPVFVIPHHPPHGDKPAFPGPGSDGYPGDVPFYPPQFPRFPGPFPDGEPGIVVPPPPEEPKPEGIPGGAPKPPGPECTLCGGGGNGGGNGNGNGPAGPPSDEGGRGDEEPSPDGLTPKGGVPEAEPKPEEPKPEEPAPEPKPEDEPKPEEPKPEEPAPEEPKPEEPQPEQPATEEPTTQAPTTEAPATEEPKIEEAMPEREGPEPGEDKSSEEDENNPTEAPASARLQFAKKGGTLVP